jgi:hypothetical protein
MLGFSSIPSSTAVCTLNLLAVMQLFALVQPQKKPSHIYVTADSHEQVCEGGQCINYLL